MYQPRYLFNYPQNPYPQNPYPQDPYLVQQAASLATAAAAGLNHVWQPGFNTRPALAGEQALHATGTPELVPPQMSPVHPPLASGGNETPCYVNAKQFSRILKRRVARQKLEKKYGWTKKRKPIIHESRKQHAMRRPRKLDGRFWTTEEYAELEAKPNRVTKPPVSPTQKANAASTAVRQKAKTKTKVDEQRNMGGQSWNQKI